MIPPRFVLVSSHNNQQQASLLHVSNREDPVPYPFILPTLSFGQVTAPVHEINSTDTTRVETRQRDQNNHNQYREALVEGCRVSSGNKRLVEVVRAEGVEKEGVGAVKRGGAMLRRQRPAEEGYRIIYPDQEVDTK